MKLKAIGNTLRVRIDVNGVLLFPPGSADNETKMHVSNLLIRLLAGTGSEFAKYRREDLTILMRIDMRTDVTEIGKPEAYKPFTAEELNGWKNQKYVLRTAPGGYEFSTQFDFDSDDGKYSIFTDETMFAVPTGPNAPDFLTTVDDITKMIGWGLYHSLTDPHEPKYCVLQLMVGIGE